MCRSCATQVAVVGRSPVMTPTATGSNAAPTADEVGKAIRDRRGKCENNGHGRALSHLAVDRDHYRKAATDTSTPAHSSSSTTADGTPAPASRPTRSSGAAVRTNA